MKNFAIRLFLAGALVAFVTLLGASANAQEPNSQEPAATAPPTQQSPSGSPQDQQTPSATPPEERPQEPAAGQQQNEPQMPASGTAPETRSATSFTGRIVKEDGKIVLKDPITKTSYRIEDSSKAKPYMGKQVKVTGKVDMHTNTIQIENIEPLSTE